MADRNLYYKNGNKYTKLLDELALQEHNTSDTAHNQLFEQYTKKNAIGLFDAANNLGKNFMPPNQTTEGFAKLGLFCSSYFTHQIIKNQPSQYGILLSIPSTVDPLESDIRVAQLWFDTITGDIYTRRGTKNNPLSDVVFDKICLDSAVFNKVGDALPSIGYKLGELFYNRTTKKLYILSGLPGEWTMIVDASEEGSSTLKYPWWKLDSIEHDDSITVLSENADLNSYTTADCVSCPSASIASTLVNSPITDSNFRMVIQMNSDGWGMQILFAGTSNTIYTRGITMLNENYMFTEWNELITANSKVQRALMAERDANGNIISDEYLSKTKGGVMKAPIYYNEYSKIYAKYSPQAPTATRLVLNSNDTIDLMLNDKIYVQVDETATSISNIKTKGLHVDGDVNITGGAAIKAITVNENAHIRKTLRVMKSSQFDGDVYIKDSGIIVDGSSRFHDVVYIGPNASNENSVCCLNNGEITVDSITIRNGASGLKFIGDGLDTSIAEKIVYSPEGYSTIHESMRVILKNDFNTYISSVKTGVSNPDDPDKMRLWTVMLGNKEVIAGNDYETMPEMVVAQQVVNSDFNIRKCRRAYVLTKHGDTSLPCNLIIGNSYMTGEEKPSVQMQYPKLPETRIQKGNIVCVGIDGNAYVWGTTTPDDEAAIVGIAVTIEDKWVNVAFCGIADVKINDNNIAIGAIVCALTPNHKLAGIEPGIGYIHRPSGADIKWVIGHTVKHISNGTAKVFLNIRPF